MRQEQVWDCVLISPTGNRTWSVRPAQACPMGKGGTLPEENMLENYLSCCTILGAHNLSWRLHKGDVCQLNAFLQKRGSSFHGVS